MAGAKAVKTVSRIVNISSIGAGANPTWVQSHLLETSNRFNQTAANVLHLRPGYFMENFLSKSRRFEAIALYIFVMLVTTIFPGLVLTISAMKQQSIYSTMIGQASGL